MWSLAAGFQDGMKQKSGNLIKDQENIWKTSKYYLDRKMLWTFSAHFLFVYGCVCIGCVCHGLNIEICGRVCASVLPYHRVDPGDRSQLIKLSCKCPDQLNYCTSPLWIFDDIVIIRITPWLLHILIFVNILSSTVRKVTILDIFSSALLFNESLIRLSATA